MSSSLRRGALATAAIAFSLASVAACGAGNNAQTLEIKPDNAATSVGAIKLQNIVVITQPNPEVEGPAVISGTVFNNGPTAQTLDSISVPGGGTAEITPAKGKGRLTVPAGGSVVLGGPGNASAALNDLGTSVQNGNAQKVTFTFSDTGEVSLRAFVVPAENYFTKWGPTKVPSTPGGSAAPGGSAKPGTGRTPGGGESATGSPNPAGSPATPTDASSASTSESPAAGH
ncbi:copper(I)-binding protein [Streptomyces sp. LBL]|uniref:copper chaperone PCu(A)C n=1 Tax=Streptomyces sp. LBL TaxID=2940562 RepID=UPI0024768855|nr:copper chaperone PCu(A)C [Streptomyces sp. LBL]MDH6630070.1 copper(I)-binding protein [Streptomyces sp. LBL]